MDDEQEIHYCMVCGTPLTEEEIENRETMCAPCYYGRDDAQQKGANSVHRHRCLLE